MALQLPDLDRPPRHYLKGLYVDPQARGGGIARKLFEALGEVALDNDCARSDWSVLDWNEVAKDLYRKLGARHMRDWEPWRVDEAALEALGKRGPRQAIKWSVTGTLPRGLTFCYKNKSEMHLRPII